MSNQNIIKETVLFLVNTDHKLKLTKILSSLNEFYQNMNDYEDFKIQWYSYNPNILRKNYIAFAANHANSIISTSQSLMKMLCKV